MKKLKIFLKVLIIATFMFTSCEKSEVESNSLIGTWALTSVNGQQIQVGVYLKWTFTENTVTVTSDLDCIEVIQYEAIGGILKGIKIISQEGSQCGVSNDNIGEIGPYTIDGNTLSIIITDSELDPPTATFLFTKI